MKTSTLQTWIWVLIYGGLLTVGLGLAVRSRDAALGSAIGIAGGVAAALGLVLIWVRSRRSS